MPYYWLLQGHMMSDKIFLTLQNPNDIKGDSAVLPPMLIATLFHIKSITVLSLNQLCKGQPYSLSMHYLAFSP